MSDLNVLPVSGNISVCRSIPGKLMRARLEACKIWPFSRDAILSMVVIPMRGIGTMAVDQYWRLYFEPQFVEDHSVKYLTGVVLHELMHLINKHHARSQFLYGDKPTDEQHSDYNLAADSQINYLLREEYNDYKRRIWNRMELGDDWVFPDTIDVPENITMEKAYRILQSRRVTTEGGGSDTENGVSDDNNQRTGQSSNKGSGSGSEGLTTGGNNSSEEFRRIVDELEGGDSDSKPGEDGESGGSGTDTLKSAPDDEHGSDERNSDNGSGAEEGEAGSGDDGSGTGSLWIDSSGGISYTGKPAPVPGTGQGGSAADGIARDWELPRPTEQNNFPGLDEESSDSVLSDIARKIQEGISHGSVSAHFEDWANEIRKIRTDPRQVILRVVRRKVEEQTGIGDRSYRRPSRRRSQHDIVMPSNISVVPRIAVFVDTSGSMTKEDFALALGMINKIISSFRIRDGIKIITGDTKAKTQVHAAGQITKLKLKGGGGTDVGGIITTGLSLLKAKPHVAVAITDGVTEWPQKESDIGVPMVAVITRSKPSSYYEVPSWVETLYLKE